MADYGTCDALKHTMDVTNSNIYRLELLAICIATNLATYMHIESF